MCGRFSLDRKPEALKARFKAKLNIEPNSTPLFNIAPSKKADGIFSFSYPQVELMDWGLAGKGIDGKSRSLINARSETVEQKWPFSKLLQNRCLVVASGYIEWKTFGKTKIPHLHVLENGDLFTIAGLYEEDPETKVKKFTLLTKEANAQTADIHDRMPVIFNKENEFNWFQNVPDYIPLITFLYSVILIIWILKTIDEILKTKK
jgi:putative SOS response-associated peptidase YedK